MIMNMNKAKMINDAVMSTAVRKAEERGIEKGIEKGIEEGKFDIALNFLKMGLSVDQVASGTGLTIEEIEKIQDILL